MFFSLTKNQRDIVARTLPFGCGPSISSSARSARNALSVREMDPYMLRGIYFELHARIFGNLPNKCNESKLDIALGRSLSWCIKNDVDFPTFVAAQMHSMRSWFDNPACTYRIFMPAMLTGPKAIKRYDAFQKRGNLNKRDALDGLECYRDIGIVRSDLTATEYEVGKMFVSHRGRLTFAEAIDRVRDRGLLLPIWAAANIRVLKDPAERSAFSVLSRMFSRDRMAEEKRVAFMVAADAVLYSLSPRFSSLIGASVSFSWDDVLNLVKKLAPEVPSTNPPSTTGVPGGFLWKAAV